MTKFEQIKSMGIDEMVKELNRFEGLMDEICPSTAKCPYMDDVGDISVDCNCEGCIKKWLESEVEGNET